MTAESSLEKTFNAYLSVARVQLCPHGGKTSNVVPFNLLRNRASELRHLVDELEARQEFHDLVQQTLVGFPREDTNDPATSRRTELENFLRRSSWYVSVYDGEKIDDAVTFKLLQAEFRKESVQTRYLLPLRSVGFSEDVIEFDGFRIRRFSAEELETILQKNVNEVFFESSLVDAHELRGYWYLDIERSRPRLRIEASVDEDGRIWLTESTIQLDELDSLSFIDEAVVFPEAVTIALEPLILYDWDSVENFYSFKGVSLDIPFILQTDDDLLNKPVSVPDIPSFQVGPFIPDSVEGLNPNDYYVFIDNIEAFRAFVSHMAFIIRRLKTTSTEWNFLQVAFLFFQKAFFTPGLQQLLSHITVIGALLGEKKEGLTNLLAKRLALILGETEKGRKEVKKTFEEIYELRSTLVHGNERLLDQAAKENHLHQARKLARQTLVWFLHYLDHVLDETSVNELNEVGLPTREELLTILDIKIESRGRIKHLLKVLPADFPRTPGWLTQ